MNNNLAPQENKVVLGLDIGSTKVVALVGTLNEFGKLNVLGVGKSSSEGAVIGGQVINIEKTANAINVAIQEATKQLTVQVEEIVVGVSGFQVKCSKQRNGITRNSFETEISVEDVERLKRETTQSAITPEASSIIHALPQKYIIDNEGGIYDPVGRQGIKLEADFNIISAGAASIGNINKSLARNKILRPKLFHSGLASALAVLNEDELDEGVAFIDIGSSTTEIIIFYGKVLQHLAVLPYGGGIVTQDIVSGCNIVEKHAEYVKVQVGHAIPERTKSTDYMAIPGIKNRPPKEISITNLSRIIGSRMEELIEFIDVEILRSGWSEKIRAGLVITGGGAQLNGIKELFEFITGKEVRIGYPTEHIGKTKNDAIKSPSYSTAIGLALTSFLYLDHRDTEYKAQKPEEKPSPKPSKTKGQDSIFGEVANNFFKNIKGFISDDDLPNAY